MSEQYIIFQLNNDYLGIKLDHVKEIINIDTVFKIPNTPNYIEGLINLRDKVYTLFNLRKFFNLTTIDINLEENTSKILIVNIHSLSIGLKVDIVNEITIIDESSINPPSESSCYYNYLAGWAQIDDREILILNLPSLIKTKNTQNEAYINENFQHA
ncbi:UNVERIFIED_CONTAM: purine-binding chemotaxis protein CheW [Acetivibrio alkalicellulosi]